MEKAKSYKGIIVFLIIVILILSVLCFLLATGTINLNSKETINTDNKMTNEVVDNSAVNDNSEEKKTVVEVSDKILTNDEAMDVIKSVMKKSFNYIYSLSPECGERNKNDVLNDDSHVYEASSSYTTIRDVKKYLHTFLSDSVINSVEEKYVTEMYKEKDNKLYCLNTNKDCAWIYDDEETNYTIGSISLDEIKAGGNIYYKTCDNAKKAKPVSFVLKRNSDKNWILDTYQAK